MPKGKPPLTPAEIDLVKSWIAQGAVDDTPRTPRRRYDKDHPPIYTRPPVITATRFLARRHDSWPSPGFTKCCSGRPTARELVARLVGLAERIESVKFSPDGTRLAVTGGQPARMGEVQVWDVAKRKLRLSRPRHLRHRLRRKLVARRDQDRLRMRRQQRPGDRRQDGRASPVHGVAQRLGARHHLLGRWFARGLRRP